MIFYEYDDAGFLIGWYEADEARPGDRSTIEEPPHPRGQARWVDGAWTLDQSRETQQENDRTAERNRRAQIRNLIRDFDPDNATNAQLRATVAALCEAVTSLYRNDG